MPFTIPIPNVYTDIMQHIIITRHNLSENIRHEQNIFLSSALQKSLSHEFRFSNEYFSSLGKLEKCYQSEVFQYMFMLVKHYRFRIIIFVRENTLHKHSQITIQTKSVRNKNKFHIRDS